MSEESGGMFRNIGYRTWNVIAVESLRSRCTATVSDCDRREPCAKPDTDAKTTPSHNATICSMIEDVVIRSFLRQAQDRRLVHDDSIQHTTITILFSSSIQHLLRQDAEATLLPQTARSFDMLLQRVH